MDREVPVHEPTSRPERTTGTECRSESLGYDRGRKPALLQAAGDGVKAPAGGGGAEVIAQLLQAGGMAKQISLGNVATQGAEVVQLGHGLDALGDDLHLQALGHGDDGVDDAGFVAARANVDRKSTRLNSSHVASSYAVFCLK